jgi:hypothetical protein
MLPVEDCTELKVDHSFADDHKTVGVVTSPYKKGGAYEHPEGLTIQTEQLYKSFVFASTSVS